MANGQNTPSRYAVVVGVNNYAGSRLPNLNYCANDALAFYDALINYAQYDPDKVVLFSDSDHEAARTPSYSDILSSIQQICSQATEEDSILFFFAGHGTRDEQDSYLLTREYRANVLADSSISMGKVNSYFESSRAKFKMRFFDACHSGRIGVRGLLNPNIQEHFIVDAEGWATLAACKEDQYAHELADIQQGIFSFFLVRGLRGDASVDGQVVTLDNLKVYVMDKIIELTKKRGVEQTPVFAGAQAGSLTLSHVLQLQEQSLPEILVKIEEVKVAELEPEPDDTNSILLEVRKMLQARHASAQYVATNQEQKLAMAADLADHILSWGTKRAENDNASLPDGTQFAVQRGRIDDAPLNRQIGRYLHESKVKRNLEWELQLSTETRTRQVQRPTRGIAAIQSMLYPEYVEEQYQAEVATGVKEPAAYPNSTIILQFKPADHLFPICCMVIALVPSTFGLYLLGYFASTALGKEMKEMWNPGSFSVRLFMAVPLSEDVKQFTTERLNETHAQFVSFIAESIQARQLLLQQLGAAPDTSLI